MSNLTAAEQQALNDMEAAMAATENDGDSPAVEREITLLERWLSVLSNAEGARLAATNPRWAAIASLRAGSQFGLHVAAPAIQDDAYNRTRFAVMCLPQTLAMPEASGNDCTSLVVSVVNRPGAVYELIEPIKRHGVSMTRFESRPARSGQPWEYFFYIDLQGHLSQPQIQATLTDLRPICAFYTVLGSYAING